MGNKVTAAEVLRDVAKKQEATLEGINEFKPSSNEYSATNAEVTSSTNGTPIDIQQRKTLTTINQFNANNEYKSPE